MKAIAVIPGTPDSIHLRDIPEPTLNDIPDGNGVLIRTLKVGVDATDREINESKYGNPPPGDDYLVLGHEFFGVVEEIGDNVTKLVPGDLVACTVRRPGGSIWDRIGHSDLTGEETYFERGINLLHGFLTERIVDHQEFVVKVPIGLKHLHVLAEPMSCAAKAVQQAFEAQRRLKVWEPRVAYVMGAGQIGLLATLILRLRGFRVYTLARSPKPILKAEIAEGYGAEYVSLKETTLEELTERTGKPDLIIEATGSSRSSFQAMQYLNINGVLVWTGVTGGDLTTEVPADKINLEWVLGNKLLLGSVNGNFRHFESGLADLASGEMTYPGVTERILTDPVDGLDRYGDLFPLLERPSALKVYVNVSDL